MKSVVNMLPEVATWQEKKAVLDLCDDEEKMTQKIMSESKSIKKDNESKDKLPGDQRDYEKLDLKVELLLHHL